MEDEPKCDPVGYALGLARSLIAGDEVSTDDIILATGSHYCYPYVELCNQASVAQVNAYCSTTRRLFAPIAKSFDVDLNSRWILRHYLAIKFITASNLLAGSAIYAYDNNLMLSIPYLNYYAVLNSCRAYLMTSPHVTWNGTKTLEMTHQNIINRTVDYLRALDPKRVTAWASALEVLRDRRELFSYRFPLSGAALVGKDAFEPDPARSLACLIAELASLNSECLDASPCKHSSGNIPVREMSDHEWATAYDLAGARELDGKDQYRFSKLLRQWKTVSPLQLMCSDGLMDDVYSAWSDSYERPGVFNPDDYSRLVLSL